MYAVDGMSDREGHIEGLFGKEECCYWETGEVVMKEDRRNAPA